MRLLEREVMRMERQVKLMRVARGVAAVLSAVGIGAAANQEMTTRRTGDGPETAA